MQAEMGKTASQNMAPKCKCRLQLWRLTVASPRGLNGCLSLLQTGKLMWRCMIERGAVAATLVSPQQLALPEFATTGKQVHVQGSLSQPITDFVKWGFTYLSPELWVSMLQQTANMLYTGVHSWLSFQEVLPDLAHECSKAHEG